MRHLDLFSGIGGFALASEMVWENVEHTFVEYDPFCQQILRKHWPEAEIHGDIRAFIAHTKSARHGREIGDVREKKRRSKRDEVFGAAGADLHILTGGFPCQPFSHAGRRKGTADDRYLWPPMLEAIALFRPKWVIAENVAGLVTWNDGLVLETVCSDLEREGYEVQPFIIPACAVGAPHRRDRVWIVAHSYAYDTRLERSEEARNTCKGRQTSQQRLGEYFSWSEPWHQVATRLCRVDDGIPRRLDRTPRLKALGNAIVPQVAAQIMSSIALSE